MICVPVSFSRQTLCFPFIPSRSLACSLRKEEEEEEEEKEEPVKVWRSGGGAAPSQPSSPLDDFFEGVAELYRQCIWLGGSIGAGPSRCTSAKSFAV